MFLTDEMPLPRAARGAPIEAGADWIVPQCWADFTRADHACWDILFARQKDFLTTCAVERFNQGIQALRLSDPGIPCFEALNNRLRPLTGWSVVAVPGMVPDDVFFALLAARQFPAGNFIRSADRLDYLEEPDVFHDVFGHVPLLADPAFADFMQALGELGRDVTGPAALERLARLYWYTVEFGLAREAGVPRIYGAGIASSLAESRHAIDAPDCERLPFDLARVMATPYLADRLQPRYFVIDSFEDMLALVSQPGLAAMLEADSDGGVKGTDR